MMRSAMPLLPCFLAILPFSTAVAQEADREPAQVVAAFAEAVNKGHSIAGFEFDPAPIAEEISALRALAGCTPQVAEGSNAKYIKLDWSCNNAPEAERQTGLEFGPKDGLSLWINPLEASFAPTRAAEEIDDPPGPRQTLRRFARAVRSGEDPSLGGLIPLTAEQRARLDGLINLPFKAATGNTSTSQTLFWDLTSKRLNSPVVTTLTFDDDGRPIGVTMNGSFRLRS